MDTQLLFSLHRPVLVCMDGSNFWRLVTCLHCLPSSLHLLWNCHRQFLVGVRRDKKLPFRETPGGSHRRVWPLSTLLHPLNCSPVHRQSSRHQRAQLRQPQTVHSLCAMCADLPVWTESNFVCSWQVKELGQDSNFSFPLVWHSRYHCNYRPTPSRPMAVSFYVNSGHKYRSCQQLCVYPKLFLACSSLQFSHRFEISITCKAKYSPDPVGAILG